MTLALVFVVIAVVALGLLIYLATATRLQGGNLDELAAQLRPIDVEAFRNLIDEDEEQFLRERLPPSDFRIVHRERMLAATDYVRGAARNAAILIRLAEAARTDPDPAVARAAESLLENATQVRIYAFQVVPRFYASMLIPSLNHAPYSLAEKYDTMARQSVMLGCLRYSA